MKCPECHFENPDLSRACAKCGASLLPLEATRGGPTVTLRSARTEDAVGAVLGGKYRILEELGKGGMGTVFMAEQIEPVKRRVAVKIIKLGMDTRQVVARFEAERQALALMDHPNIAKVYDAGATETGRPYFVMELVRGISLTEYCDKHMLGTRDRLKLFIPVCKAVQHAHQKGLIHRDLKPSNVLVAIQDDKPVPKIIDFGIAKATDRHLSQQTLFTEQGQLIGTPEYMSPEQAEMSGLDIDTRTDIYSLGVTLYELLVGVLPFDPKGLRAGAFSEIRRIIRETDPPKASTRFSSLGDTQKSIADHRHTDPGTLRKQLKGDLDWIIMKAMEKDRTRRYETSNALAMDIQRYLNSEPIVARPPNTVYKMAKFARRHKAGLAAGAFVALALVLGLVLATTGLIRAKRAEAVAARERDRANQEAAAAKQVSDFLIDLFKVSNPSEALGNTITAREILDKGAERIEEELNEQPMIKARIMDVMGVVYTNLGLYGHAMSLLEQALSVKRRTVGGESMEVSDTLNSLASLYRSKGDFKEAEKLFREALEICVKLKGEDHLDVASCLNNLAVVVKDLGKYDEAEPMYRKALEIRRKHLGSENSLVAQSLNNLGMYLYRKGELAEAEELFHETLAINRKVLGEEHTEVAVNMNNLALVLRDSGKYAEAEAMFRQVIAMERKFYGNDHPFIAQGLTNLASVLQKSGKLAEAEGAFREALDIFLKTFPVGHWQIATAKNLLGGCLTASGAYVQAEGLLVEGYRIIRDEFGAGHPRTQSALKRVVELYEAWGKTELAARYRKLLN